MQELVLNLHIHTTYSDGEGTYQEIASAAARANLDAVILTDHNVYVDGLEQYVHHNDHTTLIITGEEIHDRSLQPSKNHLLILGIKEEFCHLAHDPQALIDEVNLAGGISFIAHPFDTAVSFIDEKGIIWNAWHVKGFTGLEIWNVMSELKHQLHSKIHALIYAFFPQLSIYSANHSSLECWDSLTIRGERIVGIGSSDAHARSYSMGLLKAKIFPYDFHFKSVNTHILTNNRLSGNLVTDKKMIIDALRQGHAFVSNDLPCHTRGFRFIAMINDIIFIMGDEIITDEQVTFHIQLPRKCRCHLLKDGIVFQTWKNTLYCTIATNQPGVYRIECYLFYRGCWRGWIYSNPIYLRSNH